MNEEQISERELLLDEAEGLLERIVELYEHLLLDEQLSSQARAHARVLLKDTLELLQEIQKP